MLQLSLSTCLPSPPAPGAGLNPASSDAFALVLAGAQSPIDVPATTGGAILIESDPRQGPADAGKTLPDGSAASGEQTSPPLAWLDIASPPPAPTGAGTGVAMTMTMPAAETLAKDDTRQQLVSSPPKDAKTIAADPKKEDSAAPKPAALADTSPAFLITAAAPPPGRTDHAGHDHKATRRDKAKVTEAVFDSGASAAIIVAATAPVPPAPNRIAAPSPESIVASTSILPAAVMPAPPAALRLDTEERAATSFAKPAPPTTQTPTPDIVADGSVGRIVPDAADHAPPTDAALIRIEAGTGSPRPIVSPTPATSSATPAAHFQSSSTTPAASFQSSPTAQTPPPLLATPIVTPGVSTAVATAVAWVAAAPIIPVSTVPASSQPRPIVSLAADEPKAAAPTQVRAAAIASGSASPATPAQQNLAARQASAPIAQPAGVLFGIALGAAVAATQRPAADDKASPRDAALQALTAAAGSAPPLAMTAAAGSAQHGALDMRRDDWPQAMIDRIEAMRDAADANNLSIRLVPDALGKVDLSIRHDSGAVHVHFAAETPATQQLIADAQPRLADAAQARGLKLVQTSADAGGFGTGAGANQQQGNAMLQSRTPLRPAHTPAAAAHESAAAPDSTRLA